MSYPSHLPSSYVKKGCYFKEIRWRHGGDHMTGQVTPRGPPTGEVRSWGTCGYYRYLRWEKSLLDCLREAISERNSPILSYRNI